MELVIRARGGEPGLLATNKHVSRRDLVGVAHPPFKYVFATG